MDKVFKSETCERPASGIEQSYPFRTLPDYLQPGLDLVFVGINPGLYSVQQGHYFARSTSRFWPALSRSRLSERVRQALGTNTLRPEHDAELIRFGFGFTDVVKRPSASVANLNPGDFEKWVPYLVEKLLYYRPRVACFHGLTGYRPFLSLAFGCDRRPALGHQPEALGGTSLYAVPNPSPANAHFTPADQTAWYNRLADFLATAYDPVGCTYGYSQAAPSGPRTHLILSAPRDTA